jgi:hypothetical protein
MKASDLYVVCKPSGPTDMPGGDPPRQSYVYAVDHDGKAYACDLADALVTDRRGAIQCLANVMVYHTGFGVVSLADAITRDQAAAVARATLSIAAGLTACWPCVKEDDPAGPRRPLYHAVQAAINALPGKPPDDRPWTAEETLQREG